jgi:hypothetical protein
MVTFLEQELMTVISAVETLQENGRHWILWTLNNAVQPGWDVWTQEMTAVQMVTFLEQELMTVTSAVETLQGSVLSQALTWSAIAFCSQRVRSAETCSGGQEDVTYLSKTNSFSYSNDLCVIGRVVLVFRVNKKNKSYYSCFVCDEAVFCNVSWVCLKRLTYYSYNFSSRETLPRISRFDTGFPLSGLERSVPWESM